MFADTRTLKVEEEFGHKFGGERLLDAIKIKGVNDGCDLGGIDCIYKGFV